MKFQSNIHVLNFLRAFVNLASMAICGLGLLVMLGWIMDVASLRSILPGLPAMRFNTALSLLLIGLSLWLLQNEETQPTRQRVGKALAGLALLLSLLTLTEYLFRWDLGIDQLFIKDVYSPAHLFPGRMSPVAVLSSSLSSTALLLIGRRVSQHLSLGVFILSMTAIMNFLFGFQVLFGNPQNTYSAVQTAGAFLLLSLAILAARPTRGMMEILSSNLPGGRAMRLLLPAIVLLTIITGWLVERAESRGFLDPSTDSILLVTLLIFVYSPLIYFIARHINQAEEGMIYANRLYAVLSQVNGTIVRVKSRQELFENICNIAVDVGKFRLAWIGLFDPDSGVLDPVAIRGYAQNKLPFQEINALQDPFLHGLIGRSLQTGEVVFSHDIQTDPGMKHWHDLAIQADYHSAAAVPIRQNGQITALLSLYAADIGFFTVREEQSLLEEIGLDISFALDTMAIESERKRAEEAALESETRYQRVLDAMMEGCQIIDFNWRYVYVNDVVAAQGKHSRAELLNRTMMEVYPGIEHTELFASMQQCMEERVPRRMENQFLFPDGSIGWFELSIQPAREGIFILSTDITERKRAEEAVLLGQKRFQSLIEHAPDGIALLGLDGKLRQVTPSTQWILGYSAEDATGQDPALLTHPDDLPGLLQLLQGLIQTPDGTVRTQYRFRHRDGSWRWLESTISNLIQEPSVAAIIFNYRDITEQKEAEKKLRESAEQYRSLFENSPISLWVENFAAVKQRLDQLKERGIQDLPAYLEGHPEFVRECMESIQILDVNSAAMKLYDATDKNSLLGSILDIWPHLSPDQFLHELTQLANGQRSFEREATDQTLSGRKINVNVHWSVVPGSEDTLDNVIVSTVDITESKQAAERIQRQLQRLRGLRAIDVAISSSFDIHVSLDVLLNEAITQLEVDAATVLQLDPSTRTLTYAAGKGFTSPAIQETRLHLSQGVAGRAAVERREIFIEDLDHGHSSFVRRGLLEQERFASYFVAPLIAKGEVKGVLEIFHRSTLHTNPEWLDFLWALAGQAAIALENAQLFENLHRSNLELEHRVIERTVELHRTNVELERANRAKDEFLATMSHELRTPLNSILGLSESLLEERRGSLNEYQQHSLRIIETSGQHLLELINDILDLSKIEAGMFNLYLQPISVDEFCRSCLAFVREQSIRKSITLTYTNESGIAKILADPRRLKQIFVNLLSNAVKFTPKDGQIRLHVEGYPEQDRIEFSVIDSGIGIATEDLKRLFQPFVQVDGSLNRQYQGTGLGLALVQKLTDLHGGSVAVESEVGKGSRFTVNLTIKQEEIAKLEGTSQSSRSVGGELVEQMDTPLPREVHRGVILLADDNPPNILTVGEYLESYGYEVVTARDGFEAIAKAADINPDLILMDIQMPVINGLDAIARLRADPGFASTPIIALTALAMPGDRERCLQAGANDYLSKPVSLKLLVKTIKAMIDRRNGNS